MGFVLRLFIGQKGEGLEKCPAAALTRQPELMEHGQTEMQSEGMSVHSLLSSGGGYCFCRILFSFLSCEGEGESNILFSTQLMVWQEMEEEWDGICKCCTWLEM